MSMELEQLKGKILETDVSYSKSELEDIFKIKTQSAVQRINRTMLIDALVMIGLTALLVLITFYLGLKSRYVVSSQIIGAAAILLVHYKIKYRLINVFNPNLSVIENAQKTYNYLKRYCLAYYIITPLLTLSLSFNLYLQLNLDWSTTSIFLVLLGITIITLACTHLIVRIIYYNPKNRIKTIILQFNNLSV
ncbi:hypothetical protein [Fulvivirga lutea]|uniref:Uncharacterized protein n=1 Tax=Fulvivirga lutea TaxID=2810512 RepID=A0A975A0F5_9BACT|nr:hypothetical protein [Fulvivirga lutea]QSE97135.1 hypothetical protein JR347_16310 [Fulvivirga lutea]